METPRSQAVDVERSSGPFPPFGSAFMKEGVTPATEHRGHQDRLAGSDRERSRANGGEVERANA